jgi:hypothetical protein
VTDRVGPNGEKILHVEEIQSDWHQAGRKKGYNSPQALEKIQQKRQELLDQKDYYNKLAMPYVQEGKDAPPDIIDGWTKAANGLQELDKAQSALGRAVPDAPFKQNWHELVMKRLLDDAVRNGYDKVVITPGAEQAKRYDLSKEVDRIAITKTGGVWAVNAWKDGMKAITKDATTDADLANLVGKELADKAIKQGGGEYAGLDLQVGGEGMKGFYDQIVPSYLNDYGKRYGVTVGTYDMPIGEKMVPDRAGLGMIRSGEQEMAPFHSFDITPQMREEITTKGQSLYQAAPPVAIGAGAAMQEEPAEYAGGGAVKKAKGGPVTNDAMWMAVQNKQLRKKHGN